MSVLRFVGTSPTQDRVISSIALRVSLIVLLLGCGCESPGPLQFVRRGQQAEVTRKFYGCFGEYRVDFTFARKADGRMFAEVVPGGRGRVVVYDGRKCVERKQREHPWLYVPEPNVTAINRELKMLRNTVTRGCAGGNFDETFPGVFGSVKKIHFTDRSCLETPILSELERVAWQTEEAANGQR